MPKTTIHEDHHPLFWESEVRSSKQRSIATPAANAVTPKKLDHSQLSVAITFTSDRRHDGGSLFN
jgi:hypothetical protein